MGQLVLVRHGQASLFAENYDKLSPIGETQSRLLGEYWASRQVVFDQVVTGPCVRQIHTAELVGEAYKGAGLAWPEPIVLEELDEYEAQLVLKNGVAELAEKHDHIRELRELFHQSNGHPETVRNFQRLFEVVIMLWAEGKYIAPGVLPWEKFGERVGQGIARITNEAGKGKRVAAFTSGGPISVAMRLALGTSPLKTLQLSWMMRNSGISEFLFSRDRFTLRSYNATPHLDKAELLTHW